MPSDSFDQAFARRARLRRTTNVAPTQVRSRSSQVRMPSAAGYMLAAGGAAIALFFTLWLMLHTGEDDAPWVPAGLAASVVMLVAIAAREVVMRRVWTRYILENDRREQPKAERAKRDSGVHRSGAVDSNSTALRALKRQCAEADAPHSLPEAHLEAYLSCQEYLESTDESLRSATVRSEKRIALRAGQEHVRALARHHLLDWAREASRNWTNEAQQRVRLSDKIETAQRALGVIESALKLYPEEIELHESEAAVEEFISSVKVSHWVELAERAAFKGYYGRAIDRYRDALFYLSRGQMKEERRAETAERIAREIELLRARLKTSKITADPTSQETRKQAKAGK